jgi:broad specificity polyphosphatase/5'/3'-nucleotidase SurE
VLNCNVPASPRSDWRDPLLLPHGMSGFDEQYRPGKRRGGTVGWRLHGERRELEGEGETDAHGLRDGHPVLTFLKPDLNPTDGPGRRWQDRLLAVGRPL